MPDTPRLERESVTDIEPYHRRHLVVVDRGEIVGRPLLTGNVHRVGFRGTVFPMPALGRESGTEPAPLRGSIQHMSAVETGVERLTVIHGSESFPGCPRESIGDPRTEITPSILIQELRPVRLTPADVDIILPGRQTAAEHSLGLLIEYEVAHLLAESPQRQGMSAENKRHACVKLLRALRKHLIP